MENDDEVSLHTPNCPQCLHQMEAVVGAWWCADCRVTVRPE
jgi:tRNA(Ile2) C34 agmatinyltransferase TiaS